MYCRKCGAYLDDDDLFCGACGQKNEKIFGIQEQPVRLPAQNRGEEPLRQPAQIRPQTTSGEPEAFRPRSEQPKPTAVREPEDPYAWLSEMSDDVRTPVQPTDRKPAQPTDRKPAQPHVKAPAAASGPAKAKTKKKKKKRARTTMIAIGGKTIRLTAEQLRVGAIALAAVVAVIVLFSVTKSAFSFEHTAKAFAKAVYKGNWNSVYSLMDMNSDGAFVTKDAFLAACKETPDLFGDFSDSLRYDLSQANEYGTNMGLDIFGDGTVSQNDGAGVEAYFMRSYGRNGSGASLSFRVVKAERFWFFDKYVAVPENSPVVKYSILAPHGSTVTVNGKKVNTSPEKEGARGATTDEYTISAILPGKYTLSVKHSGCKDYTAEMTVYPQNYTEFVDDSDITGSGGTSDNEYKVYPICTQELQTALQSRAANYAAAIVSAAANETGTVSGVEYYDEDSRQQIQKAVDSVVEQLKDASSDGFSFSKIRVTQFRPQQTQEELPFDSIMTFTFEIEYAYTWQYDGEDGEDSGEEERTEDAELMLRETKDGWKVFSVSFSLEKTAEY
ncbi:MAG: hypothetical protein IJT44_04755 [Clostridia bacterium]|nr:hypothetical protein [Clostridia bacterium]